MKTKKSSFITSVGERISYGLYFVGQNVFYMLIFLFLLPFFTDVGISPAAVGGITLIVKIWDAINDPIFGGIVDKVKFKKGKFLPWLKISLIAIPLSTILLFALPSTIHISIKIIWAIVSYILWDTAYTLCDVPIFGIVTTMTDVQEERTFMMVIGRIAAGVAAIAVMAILPGVREKMGGWLPIVIIFSVFGLFSMLPICINAKERIKTHTQEGDVGLKEMFRFLKGNKYMLIYYAFVFIYSSTAINQGLRIYLARHCFGNEGVMGLISLARFLPGIILGIFIPIICKKIDKFHLLFTAILTGALLDIVSYFIGFQNFSLFMIMLVIRSIPYGIVTVLLFMFTPDCLEYGLYKTGISAPGISFSIQTFSIKLTSAISTTVGAFALAAIGFVEGENAVQKTGFGSKLWMVYILVPAIGALCSLFLFRKYKLRDKDVKVMTKCNNGEISREEAEIQLGEKY